MYLIVFFNETIYFDILKYDFLLEILIILFFYYIIYFIDLITIYLFFYQLNMKLLIYLLIQSFHLYNHHDNFL